MEGQIYHNPCSLLLFPDGQHLGICWLLTSNIWLLQIYFIGDSNDELHAHWNLFISFIQEKISRRWLWISNHINAKRSHSAHKHGTLYYAVKSIKYIFKYDNKASDMIVYGVQLERSDRNMAIHIQLNNTVFDWMIHKQQWSSIENSFIFPYMNEIHFCSLSNISKQSTTRLFHNCKCATSSPEFTTYNLN